MRLNVEGYETVFVPDLDAMIKVSDRVKRIAVSPKFKAMEAEFQEMYFIWLGFKLNAEAGTVEADLKTIEEMVTKYPDRDKKYWTEKVTTIRFL